MDSRKQSILYGKRSSVTTQAGAASDGGSRGTLVATLELRAGSASAARISTGTPGTLSACRVASDSVCLEPSRFAGASAPQ